MKGIHISWLSDFYSSLVSLAIAFDKSDMGCGLSNTAHDECLWQRRRQSRYLTTGVATE